MEAAYTRATGTGPHPEPQDRDARPARGTEAGLRPRQCDPAVFTHSELRQGPPAASPTAVPGPHLETQGVLALPEQRQLPPGEGGPGAGRLQGPPGRLWQQGDIPDLLVAPFPGRCHPSRPPADTRPESEPVRPHTPPPPQTCGGPDRKGTAGGHHRTELTATFPRRQPGRPASFPVGMEVTRGQTRAKGSLWLALGRAALGAKAWPEDTSPTQPAQEASAGVQPALASLLWPRPPCPLEPTWTGGSAPEPGTRLDRETSGVH